MILLGGAGRVWAGPNLFEPHFLVVKIGVAILRSSGMERQVAHWTSLLS